jgi:hypothetical protein
MCAQCAATGAVVATTAATGARVWLAAKAPAWFTGTPKAAVSGVIIGGGVLATALVA